MPPAAICSSEMLPCGLSMGIPRHTGGNFGERTGTDGWVDGNRHQARIQRMEEAVRDFDSLRPYSMLSPAVSQASRCHSNHGAQGGRHLQKPQT